MAKKSTRNMGEQLGFDMGMILPKLVSVKERALISAKESPSAQQAINRTSEMEVESTTPVILSVEELTHRITSLIEEGIGTIWVEGEVSNLRRQASGHCYFTLKDEAAQLSCVLFARSLAAQGKRDLRDGLQVQLYGQISVYQPRGQYQLMVKLVQAKGEGGLQVRFEELKRRLAAEGLFDENRKKVLPRYPRRIGVVTSPTGAAIRDFLHVLHRRHPSLRVVLHPVRVQGKGAAAEIAAAITEFSSASEEIGSVDVIVVTRGGGSLEDLWEFNEEVVARAIAASSIPVVSAIGHEIDFSIADFVADLRAPTPSAAAELLSADGIELLSRASALVARIGREAKAVVERHQEVAYRLSLSSLFREPLRRLAEVRQTSDRFEEIFSDAVERRLEQLRASLSTSRVAIKSAHPREQMMRVRQRLANIDTHLITRLDHRMERERGRYARLQSALAALSPEATLARGFSITRTAAGRVVTQAAQVSTGDRLCIQLAEGVICAEAKAGSWRIADRE